MPTMANITVKKADGVTDIVWTALTPSAGDNVPAQWRSETASTQNNGKPLASLVSKFNGDRTARRVDFSMVYPQVSTDTTTGLISVANRIPLTLSIAIPLGMPDAAVAEAVAQGCNLLVGTLIQSSMKAGYAPT